MRPLYVLSVILLAFALLLPACTSLPTASVPTETVAPAPTATLEPTPGPQTVQPVTGMPAGTDGFPWWNDAVFYQIFVRSFYDSNADGVGDINGIIEKLDYLNDGDPTTTTDLGVTGLWLLPINPSPSYHGYDVTDYYAVRSAYGTLDDFKRLLDEAHKRGIKVTIDMVLNHTATSHPWFVEARNNPDSPYRDWYIFSDTNPGTPGGWGQVMWYQAGDSFYLSQFPGPLADLNYNNPAVVAEMNRVAEYWLDIGVDGFRLDAARYLVEEEGRPADSPATHEVWKQFRLIVKEDNSDAVLIGEVWTGNFAVSKYVQGDELDIAFNFELATQVVKQVEVGKADTLGLALDASVKYMPNLQFGSFLTNHDQNRLMNQIGKNPEKAKTAASLLLTMPGIPFIYYGEEIGMTGAGAHENIRTPMQWTTGEYAGFSSHYPWQAVHRDYRTGVNVETQLADPNSLLVHYQELIRLRSEHAALRTGKFYRVKAEGEKLEVFAFLRQSAQETVLVVVNMSSRNPAQGYTLNLARGALSGTYDVFPLFGLPDGTVLPALTANATGGFDAYARLPEIPANGTLVLQLARK